MHSNVLGTAMDKMILCAAIIFNMIRNIYRCKSVVLDQKVAQNFQLGQFVRPKLLPNLEDF